MIAVQLSKGKDEKERKTIEKKYKTIGKKKIYWSIDDMQSQCYYAHSYKDKCWGKKLFNS